MHTITVFGDGNIVAVDDDEMFLELIEFAYSLSGFANKFTPLTSGFLCLDYLEACQPDTMPSLVMMDINMPGMTGIETVSKIRENPNYNKLPVITMLSSSNEENDVQRSLSAGATSYIEKPYNITDLKFIRG